jgi:hypothetical protein
VGDDEKEVHNDIVKPMRKKEARAKEGGNEERVNSEATFVKILRIKSKGVGEMTQRTGTSIPLIPLNISILKAFRKHTEPLRE